MKALVRLCGCIKYSGTVQPINAIRALFKSQNPLKNARYEASNVICVTSIRIVFYIRYNLFVVHDVRND